MMNSKIISWYDPATGAFYLSKESIKKEIYDTGRIIPLGSVLDLDGQLSQAWRDGYKEGEAIGFAEGWGDGVMEGRDD